MGSNPTLGTNSAGAVIGKRGDVAKWSKAEVCKTSIRRFESARRLQKIQVFQKRRWLATEILSLVVPFVSRDVYPDTSTSDGKTTRFPFPRKLEWPEGLV